MESNESRDSRYLFSGHVIVSLWGQHTLKSFIRVSEMLFAILSGTVLPSLFSPFFSVDPCRVYFAHPLLTDDRPHILTTQPSTEPPPPACSDGFGRSAPATTTCTDHAELRCELRCQKKKEKERRVVRIRERACWCATCCILECICVCRLRGLKRNRESRPQVRLQGKRQSETVELGSFIVADVYSIIFHVKVPDNS